IVVARLGARTPAVLACLAVAFLYHRFVRPVSHLRALAFAVVLLIGFTTLGIIRSVGLTNEVGLTEASNEFEVLFATGLDVQRRAELGSLPQVPLAVRLADIFALVPSQVLKLLGAQKMTGAEWYLAMLNLSGAGVGFGFGPIAESALGFGWIELVLRGALVGVAFGALQNWYNRRGRGFWETVLFIWLVLLCYTSVRSSTAQVLALLALQFLPGFLVLRAFDTKARQTALSRRSEPAEWSSRAAGQQAVS
ncbi:MAG TPA: hypothetical protein VLH09_02250, partial [Bryobacteraceae bacterium]|nr:hypothetical protein [Bryobacteraceae bacterium]